MATKKAPGSCATGASKQKSIPEPTIHFTTVADTPAAQALDLALRGVSRIGLLEVHNLVKGISEASVEALQVVHFVRHDPAAAYLRSSNPWLAHSASLAVAELRQLDTSTEVLMDLLGPLVTTKKREN